MSKRTFHLFVYLRPGFNLAGKVTKSQFVTLSALGLSQGLEELLGSHNGYLPWEHFLGKNSLDLLISVGTAVSQHYQLVLFEFGF